MRRKTASPIARGLVELGILRENGVATILDYGCGIGQDVTFYNKMGFEASGFDPHEPFGWNRKPVGQFDFVSCLFVLNVIKEPSERKALGARLIDLVKSGGLLLLAARSPSAIESEAKKKDWAKLGDGFLSSPSKGTFQRGMSGDEILSYLDAEVIQELKLTLKLNSTVCARLLRRR
jgi:hypothetical protein